MSDDEIIIWNKDRELTWNDFKGEPDPSDPHTARSTVGYSYTGTPRYIESGKSIRFVFETIEIDTEFHKSNSWVRENKISSQKNSEILLKHEQGHFDLAEEIRPEIEKRLWSILRGKQFHTRGETPQEIKTNCELDFSNILREEVEKLRHSVFRAKEIQYDEDTDHGTILNKQDEYNERFALLRK